MTLAVKALGEAPLAAVLLFDTAVLICYTAGDPNGGVPSLVSAYADGCLCAGEACTIGLQLGRALG